MNGTLVDKESLTSEQRERMLAILANNFSHVSREQFERDLAEKNAVILIRGSDGKIVGFSTLLLYQAEFQGKAIAVVYSGDTIIEREAWGSSALPRTWIHSVWKLHRERFPELPLYWLLLTSGYRTYRFLSVFWKTFYPNPHTATPAEMEGLRDELARARFGEKYKDGVVRLGQPLKRELLETPARPDPHIRFFIERNPGYVDGDELVCLAPLTAENLTAAGKRMVDSPPGV
jgi:hypothetical protein